MKKIPGYKNYSVTEDGRVFTHKYNRFLKPSSYRRGYQRVSLTNENGLSSHSVHSLVLLTYVGPRPDGFHGSHLDGNPKNNNLSNLKWCSPKENMSHRNIHGTAQIGEKHYFSKAKEEQVIWLRKNFRENDSGHTNIYELAEKTGIHHATVTNIIRGNSWKHLPGAIPVKKKRLSDEQIELIKSLHFEKKQKVTHIARDLKLSCATIINIVKKVRGGLIGTQS